MSYDSIEDVPEEKEHTEKEDQTGAATPADEVSLYSYGGDSMWEYGHPFDELTDQQVVEYVLDMDTEYRHLKLENLMITQYLKKNDPASMEGFDALYNYLKTPAAERAGLSTIIKPRSTSDVQSTRSAKIDSLASISSIVDGTGPKVNLSQKSDMALKIIEETQASLKAFLRSAHRAKQNLRADLEEFSVREGDLLEAQEIFEHNIVTLGVDPLTQRIPAEKFLRYMQEWLKSAELNISKLRLRISNSKLQYRKVSDTLVNRQELGLNVHAVDFDQLKIENKHYRNKIDQKSAHLTELKKMNGGHNLSLSDNKKYLQKLQEEHNTVKKMIAAQENIIEVTEDQCDIVESEMNKAQEECERLQILKNKYKVPDVIEYVRLKNNLYDLKKAIKVWRRRKNIQDITMNACLRQMKNITGNQTLNPAWLEYITPESSEGDDSTIFSE